MKVCSDCGKENSDANQYCVYCGKPLENKEKPLRNDIKENLIFAFNLAASNLKVFYPSLIVVGFYILIVIAAIFIGLSVSWLSEPTSSASWIIFLIIVTSLISGFYLGTIALPFFQHVYKTAVLGEEIRLRESFRYARSMFLPFLGAYIVGMILFSVISGSLLFAFPPDFESIPDELLSTDEYPDLLTTLRIMPWAIPWFIFMIPILTFAYLAFEMMAWEKVSIIKALKLSYLFFRMRFRGLLVLVILNWITSIGLSLVPFGVILGGALGVVFNLALIDHYLNYQKSIENNFTSETGNEL